MHFWCTFNFQLEIHMNMPVPIAQMKATITELWFVVRLCAKIKCKNHFHRYADNVAKIEMQLKCFVWTHFQFIHLKIQKRKKKNLSLKYSYCFQLMTILINFLSFNASLFNELLTNLFFFDSIFFSLNTNEKRWNALFLFSDYWFKKNDFNK